MFIKKTQNFLKVKIINKLTKFSFIFLLVLLSSFGSQNAIAQTAVKVELNAILVGGSGQRTSGHLDSIVVPYDGALEIDFSILPRASQSCYSNVVPSISPFYDFFSAQYFSDMFTRFQGSFNGGQRRLSYIKQDMVWRVTCDGVTSKPLHIIVGPAPAPTLNLTANPTSIFAGEGTTLSWTSTNTNSCSASSNPVGTWSGIKNTSGEQTITRLYQTTTFTLTCTGAGGSVSRSVTVTVNALPPVPPTLNLSASPTSVQSGGSSTLSWTSTNTDTCSASSNPSRIWAGTKNTSGSQIINNITQNTTFTLTCTGPDGSVTKSVTVTIIASPLPPTISLSATPTNVVYGGATSLTWSSTNTTTCTASGGWSGSKSTNGSQIISNLTAATTFTLNCTGPGGTVSQSVTVTVNSQAPTVNLSASPLSVQSGGSTNLTWTSTNATSCTASGGWTGTKVLNSTTPEVVSNITSNKTFTLTCRNAQGETSSASVTVAVLLPISVTIQANPATVSPGGTTQISWTTTNTPASCTASDGWSGNKSASGGSQNITISNTTTFTITCIKGAETAVNSVVVSVIEPLNVTLTATPNPVALNSNVTLNWNGDNADTCTASSTPATTWTGSKNTIGGTEIVNNLQQATTFTITCTKSGVNASASILVNIVEVPVITLTANPSSILSGGSTVVTWSVTNNPDSCVASNGWNGNKSTSGGTETVSGITQNTTFILSCIKDGVNIIKSATVNVYSESLSLSSTRVLSGKTTLRWTAVNMTSCVATTENPNSGLNWEGTKTSSPSPYTGQTTNVLVTAADTADLNLKNRYILSCVGALSSLPRSVILHLDINDSASTGVPNYQEN